MRQVAFLIGCLSAVPCFGTSADAPTTQERLRTVSQSVDRIVVSRTWTPPGRESEPFEITGRDQVAALINLLQFDPVEGGFEMPCLCEGTHRLEFFRGSNFKFGLTYHHWTRLRSETGGPWHGDAVLEATAADRFISWFAEQGFSEFQDEREAANKNRQMLADRRGQVAELFPEEVRSWLSSLDRNASWDPEVQQRIPAFAARYNDKSDLLLAVWGAFALIGDWTHSVGLRIDREPATFLLRTTESLTTADISRALSRTSDIRVQLGAMRHLASASEKHAFEQLPTQTKVELARAYMLHGPQQHWHDLASILFKWSLPESDNLLYEMAAETTAAVHPDSILGRARPEFSAILQLAKRPYPPLRQLIGEKRRQPLAEEERLLLDIAERVFDPRAPILPVHLTCTIGLGEAAELAWRLLLEGTPDPTDIALLAAAARSPSYRVQADADGRLAKFGVKLERSHEPTVSSEEAETIRALIKKGAYDEARRLLIAARAESPRDWIVVNLALGRLGEADDVLRGELFRKEPLAELVAFRAGLAYSICEYEPAAADFGAAFQLAFGDAHLVFQHLSLLHLGRGAESPLNQWEPFPLGDDDLRLPDQLILFLQGKQSEGSTSRWPWEH